MWFKYTRKVQVMGQRWRQSVGISYPRSNKATQEELLEVQIKTGLTENERVTKPNR